MAGLRRSGHVSSVPSQELKPPIGRRYTKNDVGPAASTSRANDSFTPRTTDESATTTNTPIATPRIVRAARLLLARIESIAIATPSRACISRARSFIDAGGVGLERESCLVSKRFDPVETRRAARRI